MDNSKQQLDKLPEYTPRDSAIAHPIELSIDPPQRRQSTNSNWFRALSPGDNLSFFESELPLYAGYSEQSHGCIHWEIDNWTQLAYSAYSRVLVVAGKEFQIALYPKGISGNDYTSLFLVAHPYEEDAEWSACVYFALVMSNPFDPSVRCVQVFEHRFSAAERRFGVDLFEKYSVLVSPQGSRPVVEQNSVRISAYVRIIEDETGNLWDEQLLSGQSPLVLDMGINRQPDMPYINALLQVLFHLKMFRQAVLLTPSSSPADDVRLLETLGQLFRYLQTPGRPADSRAVCDALSGIHRLPLHVPEISGKLNDLLNYLSRATDNGSTAGITTILFRATKRFTLANTFGRRLRTWTSSIYDLVLDTEGCGNMTQALEKYFKPNRLSDTATTVIVQIVAFDSFPPVLFIYLNRMCRNTNAKGEAEHTHRLHYPQELDMESYLSDHASRSHTWLYGLYAVCFHNGKQEKDRYYACSLQLKEPGRWVTFADEDVQPEHDRDVFDAHLNPDPVVIQRSRLPRLINRTENVCMLVYLRSDLRDTLLNSDDIWALHSSH